MIKKLVCGIGMVMLCCSLGFAQPVGIFTGQVSIGDDNFLGEVTFANGVYSMLASGNDLCGSFDGAYYAYQVVTGNFTAQCTVEWETPFVGDFWKKMGLMARDSVSAPDDPGARHATAVIIRDLFSNLQTRREPAGGSDDIVYSDAEVVSNYVGSDNRSTIRLVRTGTQFNMWRLNVANVWEDLGFIDLPGISDTILVGIVVTSHNTSVIEQAFFRDVSITASTAVSNYSLY